MPSPPIGSIAWHDLTVPNADQVRDFYREVVGWKAEKVCMGAYHDYSMVTPAGECVAGVCHAKGPNADAPPQWLAYLVVADVDHSAARCEELGGEVLTAPRSLSGGRFCVIRDPAGAVCALWQSS